MGNSEGSRERGAGTRPVSLDEDDGKLESDFVDIATVRLSKMLHGGELRHSGMWGGYIGGKGALSRHCETGHSSSRFCGQTTCKATFNCILGCLKWD